MSSSVSFFGQLPNIRPEHRKPFYFLYHLPRLRGILQSSPILPSSTMNLRSNSNGQFFNFPTKFSPRGRNLYLAVDNKVSIPDVVIRFIFGSIPESSHYQTDSSNQVDSSKSNLNLPITNSIQPESSHYQTGSSNQVNSSKSNTTLHITNPLHSARPEYSRATVYKGHQAQSCLNDNTTGSCYPLVRESELPQGSVSPSPSVVSLSPSVVIG